MDPGRRGRVLSRSRHPNTQGPGAVLLAAPNEPCRRGPGRRSRARRARVSGDVADFACAACAKQPGHQQPPGARVRAARTVRGYGPRSCSRRRRVGNGSGVRVVRRVFRVPRGFSAAASVWGSWVSFGRRGVGRLRGFEPRSRGRAGSVTTAGGRRAPRARTPVRNSAGDRRYRFCTESLRAAGAAASSDDRDRTRTAASVEGRARARARAGSVERRDGDHRVARRSCRTRRRIRPGRDRHVRRAAHPVTDAGGETE